MDLRPIIRYIDPIYYDVLRGMISLDQINRMFRIRDYRDWLIGIQPDSGEQVRSLFKKIYKDACFSRRVKTNGYI